ncbi:MAG TPA: HEAT repeat domain-containing protein [Candidatus Dormibacteraeota bacterium]|nr:HEAT repeat domain-containing protein [Candidatus Dormibacteraeota bacterium]
MHWLTLRQLKSGNTKSRLKAAKELWQEPNARSLNGLAEALLTDPDSEVRQVAASALGRIHAPERLEPLLKGLQDKDPDVLRSVLLALRRAADEKVIHYLVPLLQHQNFGVRASAAQAIDTLRWAPSDREQRMWFAVAKGWYERAAALGVEAIPALKLTYETGPVASAVRAVEAMGAIPDPTAAKMLCQALNHQEPAVCIAAVGALGNVGGSTAVQALVPCLRNVNPQIRAESARALGILGAAEATAQICNLLQDKEWEVRREAAGALGKLKNPEMVEPLAKVLDDTDGDVREAAAIALGGTGDRRAVGPLVLALKDELASVRRIAAAGLSRIDADWVSLPETRASAEKLKVAIQDAEPAVRFFVAQLLVNLGEISPEAFLGFAPGDSMASPAAKRKRMATSIFMALLEDRDRDARQTAAEALGRLAEDRALQALTRASNDPDGDVAAAMQMALQTLKSKPNN